jgi:hypothetical protein
MLELGTISKEHVAKKSMTKHYVAHVLQDKRSCTQPQHEFIDDFDTKTKLKLVSTSNTAKTSNLVILQALK